MWVRAREEKSAIELCCAAELHKCVVRPRMNHLIGHVEQVTEVLRREHIVAVAVNELKHLRPLARLDKSVPGAREARVIDTCASGVPVLRAWTMSCAHAKHCLHDARLIARHVIWVLQTAASEIAVENVKHLVVLLVLHWRTQLVTITFLAQVHLLQIVVHQSTELLKPAPPALLVCDAQWNGHNQNRVGRKHLRSERTRCQRTTAIIADGLRVRVVSLGGNDNKMGTQMGVRRNSLNRKHLHERIVLRDRWVTVAQRCGRRSCELLGVESDCSSPSKLLCPDPYLLGWFTLLGSEIEASSNHDFELNARWIW